MQIPQRTHIEAAAEFTDDLFVPNQAGNQHAGSERTLKPGQADAGDRGPNHC